MTLSPQGSAKKAVPQTFFPIAMSSPSVLTAGDPLRLAAPLEVVTISGDFFGDKRGQVGCATSPD